MEKLFDRALCGLIGITAFTFVLFACGKLWWQERERAIAAHVGRYVVDPTTGQTDFVYGCERCPIPLVPATQELMEKMRGLTDKAHEDFERRLAK